MSQEPLNTKIFRALICWQRETNKSGSIGTPVCKGGHDWPLMWLALDCLNNHHVYIHVKEATGEVTVYPLPKGCIIQEERRWRENPSTFTVLGEYGSYRVIQEEGHFKEDAFTDAIDLIVELIRQSEAAGKIINSQE